MATASPAWIVPPVTVPGGKPVTAVPGLTPKSPVMIVGPVLVTVEAPRTAKLCAEPSGGADCARARLPTFNMQITNKSLFISKLLDWISLRGPRNRLAAGSLPVPAEHQFVFKFREARHMCAPP